MGTDCKLIQYS